MSRALLGALTGALLVVVALGGCGQATAGNAESAGSSATPAAQATDAEPESGSESGSESGTESGSESGSGTGTGGGTRPGPGPVSGGGGTVPASPIRVPLPSDTLYGLPYDEAGPRLQALVDARCTGGPCPEVVKGVDSDPSNDAPAEGVENCDRISEIPQSQGEYPDSYVEVAPDETITLLVTITCAEQARRFPDGPPTDGPTTDSAPESEPESGPESAEDGG